MTRSSARLAVLAAAAIAGTRLFASTPGAVGQPASQERANVETYDERLVRVEQQVPGFGGMFIDPEGRLAIYLVDPSQLPAARLAIEAVFGIQLIPAAGLRALPGQYTVSRLKRWSELAAPLLGLPGVILVDLDESTNRVAIGIAEESRRPAIETAVDGLAIPRQAVTIQVTDPIRPLR